MLCRESLAHDASGTRNKARHAAPALLPMVTGVICPLSARSLLRHALTGAAMVTVQGHGCAYHEVRRVRVMRSLLWLSRTVHMLLLMSDEIVA